MELIATFAYFLPGRRNWKKKIVKEHLETYMVVTPLWSFCSFDFQDLDLSSNQNPNTGRFVATPNSFVPGMPVVQLAGPRDIWQRAPRAVVLGERGSRVFLLRSSPDGPYLSEERQSEVFAPIWALEEEFADEIPGNMVYQAPNPAPEE